MRCLPAVPASGRRAAWGEVRRPWSPPARSAYSRNELQVTGFHQHTQNGIDYVLKDKAGRGAPAVRAPLRGRTPAACPACPGPAAAASRVPPCAGALGLPSARHACCAPPPPQFVTSVSVSGWYADDDDQGEELWYTGARAAGLSVRLIQGRRGQRAAAGPGGIARPLHARLTCPPPPARPPRPAGEGGCNYLGDRKQVADQKLVRGNLAFLGNIQAG